MKNFLLVLSPSLALYNQWKDILKELKSEDHNIDVLIPKPISYKSILSSLKVLENDLEISEFLVLTNPLNPYSLKKLKIIQIKELCNYRLFKLQLFIRFSVERILQKIISKTVNHMIGDLIRYLSSIAIFKKLYIKIFKTKYDYVLYDIFEERKNYILPYLRYFYSFYRISLFHANGISCTHYSNRSFWSPVRDLTILDFTGVNKSLYDWNLTNENFNYKIIGVPSHGYQKEKILKNKLDNELDLRKELNLDKDIKFIALASRPDDNNWCNFIDRDIYLKIIGQFLSSSKDYHLLIRAHPKEKELSKKQWANLLGIKSDSKYFSITQLMSLELASICEFGFSFVSDCCVDFACFGKPMIELTSLANIKYEKSSPFYNCDGSRITALASKKVSFNINNDKELKLFFYDLNKKIKLFSKEVKQGYEDCYGKHDYKPRMFLKFLENL